MSDRSLVLVLGNDLSPAAAKTSRHLCSALGRLGMNAINRDTCLVRWAASDVEHESPERADAYETMVAAKWNKFIFDYGIDTVISLDLNWLFSSRLFLGADKVKHIHSFWFGDMGTRLQAVPMFSPAPQTTLDLINHPKVSHHAFGRGQTNELFLMGVQRIGTTMLAAPAEFLEADESCTEPAKLAFMGDPGLGVPPTPQALAALERGDSVATLRRLASQEILDVLPTGEPTASWVRQCPAVTDLLAAALALRLAQPQTAAVSLLEETRTTYPGAWDFLQRNHLVIEAAMLVKAVNRYDRVALVKRLSRRGWLDVYGAPEQWKPFGIEARPMMTIPQVAAHYRRYPAHLNGPHFLRDAAANEQLFEIAACGRLSLNLDGPELRLAYETDQVTLASSDEALEAAAEEIVRDPSAALAAGEKARRHTAEKHLWEHRLGKALA